MTTNKMHADEIEITDALVSRLLAAQFPEWAKLPLTPIPSAGTDNALFRLGDDKAVRLPRIEWATGQAHKDFRWLPWLAPFLPLTIPAPLALGAPGEGYPWEWSIYRWLDGDEAALERLSNPAQAATDLARFILALQQVDPAGGPPARRGVPLIQRDRPTHEAIAALRDMYDVKALTEAWEIALQAPQWDRAPVWVHGDLLPGNLLVKQGRLSAVIDFAGLGIGDPACDLIIAWNLFSGESRDVFRTTLGVDDATWARSRGWALSQALIFIPYYLNTNPVGVNIAKRAVDEVLADHFASIN